jgi:hypothetical protein
MRLGSPVYTYSELALFTPRTTFELQNESLKLHTAQHKFSRVTVSPLGKHPVGSATLYYSDEFISSFATKLRA